MTYTQLRSWLRRSPLPASVRADGQILAIPETPSRWADLAATLEALGASRVECLGPDGQILRAVTLDSPEAPDPAEIEAIREERAERDRVREAIEIARVVADAADRAVTRHAETYAKVLERYEALVSLSVQRLAVLERGYHAALTAAARAQSDAILAAAERDAAAQGGSELAPILAALGPALLSGDSGQPKPNGKA